MDNEDLQADPEVIKVFEDRIKQQAGELVKMYEIKMGEYMYCRAIALLLETATVAYGDRMWRVLGEKMTDAIRNSFLRCTNCAVKMPEEAKLTDTMCAECVKKEEEWEREVFEDADELEEEEGTDTDVGVGKEEVPQGG